MNWISENYEWFLSGLGIFILAGLIKLFKPKSKPNSFTKSNYSENKLKGKNLNFNQTIINNPSSIDSKTNQNKSSNLDPDLIRLKEEYFGFKNEFRKYLIKKLLEEYGKNSQLEIRHITDKIEDEKEIPQSKSFSELNKLENEGLISFIQSENDVISPYSKIRLNERFFILLNS